MSIADEIKTMNNYLKRLDIKTNADRIRAMSDEELAEWLCNSHLDCTGCQVIKTCKAQKGLPELVDWLKQEVE